MWLPSSSYIDLSRNECKLYISYLYLITHSDICCNVVRQNPYKWFSTWNFYNSLNNFSFNDQYKSVLYYTIYTIVYLILVKIHNSLNMWNFYMIQRHPIIEIKSSKHKYNFIPKASRYRGRVINDRRPRNEPFSSHCSYQYSCGIQQEISMYIFSNSVFHASVVLETYRVSYNRVRGLYRGIAWHSTTRCTT